MPQRPHQRRVERLAQDFTPETLHAFLRVAAPNFRPLDAPLSDLGSLDAPFDPEKVRLLGVIEWDAAQTGLVAAVHVQGELTNRSSKKKQFDLAKALIQAHNANAALLAFYDDAQRFRLSLVTVHYDGRRKTFSNWRRYTYFVTPQEPHRTFVEQLSAADFSSLESLLEAFSVEPVTRDFFRAYETLFREAEESITLDWTPEQKRLYTQRFFNRLVFIAFLERKGWLRFQGRTDYLRALYQDYLKREAAEPQTNFHRARLNTLFFWGLNNASRGRDERNDPNFSLLRALIGDVPYLNGGLFEKEADDETWFFPDEITARILTDLLYRFNFTVDESTPLDVEVAVDPEMLGKMFEETVTGRHESGSYYTPKEVVSFMGQEALRFYLAEALPDEAPQALEAFVYEGDAAALHHPEAALEALRAVKVCDPACGSGAYLLGMLHELLDLRTALFTARQLDADTVYARKLEIIQNNLYGVDLDPFAVNIARLRLWLSLVVDYEGNTPPPLPNLDFKVETGDSLTAPDPSGKLELGFRSELVKQFVALKNRYLTLHEGGEAKQKLQQEIADLRTAIQKWLGRNDAQQGFDWAVEFAEVFAPELAPETLSGRMAGIVNAAPGQLELAPASRPGGFDIVITNPPYGIPVKTSYTHGAENSYVVFMQRALHLLRPKGIAEFIVPTSWETGEQFTRFRKKFLPAATLVSVINLPYDIFETPYVDTCIVSFKKQKAAATEPYHLAYLSKHFDWRRDFGSIRNFMTPVLHQLIFEDDRFRVLLHPFLHKITQRLPQSRFAKLGEITESKRGIEAYKYTFSSSPQGGNWRPFFKGNIYRYKVRLEGFDYVRIPERDVYFHQGKRLGVRRLISRANRLMSALFEEEFVVKKDIYLFKLRKEWTERIGYFYLLGFLNATLCSFLYLARYAAATKDDFRQATLSGLRELPVYIPTREENALIERWVEELHTLYNHPSLNHRMKTRIAEIEQSIDQFFFEAYLITEQEISQIKNWLSQPG